MHLFSFCNIVFIFLDLFPGKMTMTKMWSGGVEYNLTGQGFDPTRGAVLRAGVVLPPGVNSNRELGVRSCLLSALLCCDTQLFQEEDPSTGERTWQYRGNSSEAPIVVAARKVGLPEDIVSEWLGSQAFRGSKWW